MKTDTEKGTRVSNSRPLPLARALWHSRVSGLELKAQLDRVPPRAVVVDAEQQLGTWGRRSGAEQYLPGYVRPPASRSHCALGCAGAKLCGVLATQRGATRTVTLTLAVTLTLSLSLSLALALTPRHRSSEGGASAPPCSA